ncbi:class I adenylate-forming enzyme family protein [Saccharopolyspora sp. ASAGF58]|uniref:class I adenylate-forming enzyme family protein n=1 Tax=Saccharopolyspora sp. ASAGF58 TaxID=2719023 RepID=UPI00143FE001|nr:class I adenylate-forming enzyme family protein [Saccharopolyspora sp. ASAGF58]QIZ34492.1 acyl--CoA ligase [Saccharopolyspora sp. ASAGF58]
MIALDNIRPDARLPLPARLKLLLDRELGMGNFLDRAVANNPAPNRAFLFAQRPGNPETAPEADVVAYSLVRLLGVRNAYASWYHAQGVGKGDVVGVHVPEGIDSFLHFLALTSLGAIAALVNGRMPAEVAAEYLGRIGALGVVADEPRLARLRAAGLDTERLAFHADPADLPTTPAAGASYPGVFPYAHADDDLVMVCHTSGTTGPPKAASFGHRQFFLGKRQRLWNFPAAARNRLLTALPQSHSAGISYLMTTTLLGLPTLVMADTTGTAVRAAMRRFQPTIVAAFPQTWADLAEIGLEATGAQHVHTWINTGDAAHEAHIKELIVHGRRPGLLRSRPGSRFIDGLGSSEMGMALFRKVRELGSTDYGRCVGTPIKVVRRAVVLDDDGRELGPGRAGRLGVLTPTRTPGYWNNSDATVKSSFAGYWLTGDVVYRDERGRFIHLDRVPDVIRTADGPVYSLPLEEAILVACPFVADCSVIGVRDPGSPDAQAPLAVVRLRSDAEEVADLAGPINAVLSAAGLSEVHGVVVAREDADFPTGPTGKMLKRQLRERFADHLTGITA